MEEMFGSPSDANEKALKAPMNADTTPIAAA